MLLCWLFHFIAFFHNEFNKFSKKYLEKNIYDEVTEDIFDMSNVRIFKEIKKKK